MHNSKTKKDIADSKNSSDKSAQHVCSVTEDTVSEWLRRWTRNPLGSARRGSNPLGVAFWFRPTNMICAAIIIFAQRGSLAERSKALASGASPKGREFESHSCHFFQN